MHKKICIIISLLRSYFCAIRNHLGGISKICNLLHAENKHHQFNKFDILTSVHFSLKTRIRGALGSLLQLLVVVGFLFEYCIGPYVTYQHLAIASAFVPIMFAVSFFFFPESPYHLLAKGKREEATKALQWLRGQSRMGVQAELNDIQVTLHKGHIKLNK